MQRQCLGSLELLSVLPLRSGSALEWWLTPLGPVPLTQGALGTLQRHVLPEET